MSCSKRPLSRLFLTATGMLMLFCMVAPAAASSNDIPHPDDFFDRTIGSPGVLITHSEILEYYRMLEERSDRVRLEMIGETTLGRPFYYALISSPENLVRLDALLADNDKLYDPRGVAEAELERIVAEGKTFVIVNGQIHSTEVGASQGGLLLAWRLAAGDDPEVLGILDDVVVAHVPVHNPDGQEMVADWLERVRDTPYRNSPPPFLYHHYTGHDNNRDWYMFTQVETRLSIEMQNRFHPQFTLDQHQQGSGGARLFVPPFEDPWEPNVDAALIASNNMIGTFMGQYLTTRGYAGVEWKEQYDAWTPARAYYHTHGGVRILTEVASSDYADDLEIPFERLGDRHRDRHWSFPMPWPGGTWRFADVVDYHYASAMAALRAAADLRPHLLRGMWAAQGRSIAPPEGAPAGFIVPGDQADPAATRKLLEVLRTADVEMQQVDTTFEVDGVSFGADAVIVPFAQPAGRFARSVLERQEYPQLFLYEGGPLDPPYDVTAHTLPLMMNVRVHEASSLPAGRQPLASLPERRGGLAEPEGGSASAYLIDPAGTAAYAAAARLGGGGLLRARASFRAAGRDWPAGTFVVRPQPGVAGVNDRQSLAEVAVETGVTAVGVTAIPDVELGWVGAPRVGVYQSYVSSMPEGWLRYVLDTHGIPFDVLRDAEIAAGDLAPYDVIFLPPGSARSIVDGLPSEPVERFGRRIPASPPEFAGGIGQAGVEALRAYVNDGGVLFTWAGSTDWVTRYLDGPSSLREGLSRTEFNIPGSLLRASFDTDHWLAYGLDDEAPIFYWNSPFWDGDTGRVVARYPDADLLMSGWMQGEETLANRAALLDLERGRGHAVMVGFSPEYRAQTHNTFKVIFNAIFRPRSVER